ncbi:MAG: NUDIX hydrolase [Nitriliruptoraceae bacterium]
MSTTQPARAAADQAPLPRLLADLVTHRAGDALEARSLARTRRLLDWLDRPLDEHADPTHVTGSAIVLDADLRVLLHRHKRLARWLQPGGHLEPGEAPWDAAVRETHEETGVVVRHPDDGPRLVHVDVHEGPRGHVHLDLRYLLRAESGASLSPAEGESRDVAWWPAQTAIAEVDPSAAAAIRAALAAADR